MRATQHFHRGLLLGMTQIKGKEFQRNTLKYFLGFLFFLKESKSKKKKQRREKLFTWENSQQVKEETRNLFGFSFATTIDLN